MNDWGYAQRDPSEQLARLHHFSVQKETPSGPSEFVITVYEYFTPKDPALLFFAQANRQTNQKVAPYTPTGWGRTLLEALDVCIREIQRFPCQE